MQNQDDVNSDPLVVLSIVLPVLGKGVCLEGMLKFLTLDIAVPYEIIVVCNPNDLEHSLLERISSKYEIVRWINKEDNATTRSALGQGVEEAAGQYILVVCADTA